MRTATHAFRIGKDRKYARYSWDNRDQNLGGWDGGFGRRILGETWISHHGRHKSQSTRGVIAPGAEASPIVRGCDDVWGPTDVYGVRLPMREGIRPVMLGQVLTGMKPSDKPVDGKQNEPMMPIAWTKDYEGAGGTKGRVFTTTMGAATDLESEGVRRMLVNAVYWAAGMEKQIPERADVELVGEYKPSPYGFGGYRKGVRPAEHAIEQ
jgi:hypothetical protein